MVFQIPQASQEWKNVELKFKLTMPTAQIDKIERIQNRKLWRVFSNEIEDVEFKNGGHAKQENLFHGTRGTPPTIIYMSEEGFNLNYSNEGMWGKANYFAYNSKYSNDYSSALPTGQRQMFMATVIIGKEVVMQPDRSLRAPPN